jgi:hypothetical protein
LEESQGLSLSGRINRAKIVIAKTITNFSPYSSLYTQAAHPSRNFFFDPVIPCGIGKEFASDHSYVFRKPGKIT